MQARLWKDNGPVDKALIMPQLCYRTPRMGDGGGGATG